MIAITAAEIAVRTAAITAPTANTFFIHEYIEHRRELQLQMICEDNGETGTNFDRAGFEKMMEAVYSGRANCIVVKDLSRFGRDYLETGNYLEHIFPSLSVRFISISDG